MKFKTILPLAVIVVLFGSVYNYCFDEKLDANGDNAAYFLLGKGLAEGQGYSNYYRFPASPETHFPPGYPSFISTLITLGIGGVASIKIANGVLFLMVVLLFFFLVKRITSNLVFATVLAFVVLFNPHLIRYSTIMMSEMLFMVLTMSALLFVLSSEEDGRVYGPAFFFLSIPLVISAFYVRSIGVALVFGLLFHLLFKRRYMRAMVLISSFTLGVLPWMLRNNTIGGNSYIDQVMRVNPYRSELGNAGIGDYFHRVFNNIERYISREFVASLFQVEHLNYLEEASWFDWGLGIILIVIMILGFLSLKQFRSLIGVYFLAYLGIIMTWPDVWMGPRFLVPIIPFVLLFLFLGLKQSFLIYLAKRSQSSGRYEMLFIAILGAGFIGLNASNMVVLHRMAMSDYQPDLKHYIQAADWIKANTAEEAVVCCRKGNLFHFFSNLKVTGYKRTSSAELLLQGLEDHSVDYIVLDELGFGSSSRYFNPVMEMYPSKIDVIHQIETSRTFIAEFKPELGYSGDFRKGKRNGFGTFRWSNGQCFEGMFSGGLAHGPGALYYGDGRLLKGNWERDHLMGPAILFDRNGQVLSSSVYEDISITQLD
jgi:hypothetical protein